MYLKSATYNIFFQCCYLLSMELSVFTCPICKKRISVWYNINIQHPTPVMMSSHMYVYKKISPIICYRFWEATVPQNGMVQMLCSRANRQLSPTKHRVVLVSKLCFSEFGANSQVNSGLSACSVENKQIVIQLNKNLRE